MKICQQILEDLLEKSRQGYFSPSIEAVIYESVGDKALYLII